MTIPTEEDYEKYLKITKEINSLLDNIDHDTAYRSVACIPEHASYQKLIKMGDKIIPYLIYKMVQYGTRSWTHLYLLGDLAKEGPIIPAVFSGKFYHQVAFWLTWYTESKYYEKDDIYHGLV